MVLGSGRGRVVRVAVLAAMLLAVMTFVFARVAGAEGRPSYDAVVVQPGDTLWSIAAAHYPSDDPRARVDDIERTNHLPDPIVHAGQRLLLPRPN
jgi:LysM repeat protein